MLVQQLMILNPDADRDKMLKWSRVFDANGLLETLNLYRCNIAELPESFGAVLCTGDLYLEGNQLESLPQSFSNVSVGGSLDLYDIELRCLPPNFEQIRVGGALQLGYNKLHSLPPTFGKIRVGGNLFLNANPELTGIPEEFPNVKGKVCRF